MNDANLRVSAALEGKGISLLSDFFIAHPEHNFITVADCLNAAEKLVAPIDLERALREECKTRNDFHFFARVALFTALTGNGAEGWSSRHYLLYGAFVAMLGKENEETASRCWDFLEKTPVATGWRPVSIFDPILERALEEGVQVK